MKKYGLLSNSVFNIVAVISAPIFAIIVIPYVTRVLGVQGFGEASFVLAILAFFTSVSSLGIPIYGTREIAKGGSNEELDKLFSELITIAFLSSIIFTILLYLLVVLFETMFNIDENLLYIVLIGVFLNFLQVEWYFQGRQNYKPVALRALVSKIIAIFFIITFVSSPDDTRFFVLIMIFSVIFANIINLVNVFSYCKLHIKNLQLKRHYNSLKYFFISRVFSSIYTTADIVVLGVMSSNYHVGLYAVAIRLVRLFATLIGAVISVLLPSASNEFNETNSNLYCYKQFFNVFKVGFIVFLFIIFFSESLILILAGSHFFEAILTVKILSFMVVIISVSNYLAMKVLYPSGREKVVTNSIILGAFVSIIFSIILIPYLKHNGVAIAALVSELSVMTYQIYYVILKQRLNLNFLNVRLIKFLFSMLVWFLITNFFMNTITIQNLIFDFLIHSIFSLSLLVLILLIIKESLLMSLVKKVVKN